MRKILTLLTILSIANFGSAQQILNTNHPPITCSTGAGSTTDLTVTTNAPVGTSYEYKLYFFNNGVPQWVFIQSWPTNQPIFVIQNLQATTIKVETVDPTTNTIIDDVIVNIAGIIKKPTRLKLSIQPTVPS